MIRGIIALPLVLIWTLITGVLGLLLRLFFPPEKCVYWIAHFLWSPVIFGLYGIHLKIKKNGELPNVPAIFIANHTSQLDIPVVVYAIPRGLFFVAKKELAKVPLLGQYMQAMGMIFVDRGNREKAIQSMNEAAKKVVTGRNLVTFPEGTRSENGQLIPFKKGSFVIAQNANIPIVPIAISGAEKALKKGGFIAYSSEIKVTIGEAIWPNQHPDLSSGQLAQHAQNIIQQMQEAQRK
jgi:1-acyl-sn-glycerol-3-phosphate acyltransferase